jgi:3-phenylpropionate/cinnamic acid dioxygenase small subunit
MATVHGPRSVNRDDAESFLYREARMLDAGDLAGWLDLTAPDFTYRVPVNDAAADPARHLSIIHEDRAQISERIYRVTESGLNHTQDPPSAFLRMISNVEVETDGDEALIRSNMVLHEYRGRAARRDSMRAISYPARCEHRMRGDGARWLMTHKSVTLLQLDGPLDALSFVL